MCAHRGIEGQPGVPNRMAEVDESGRAKPSDRCLNRPTDALESPEHLQQIEVLQRRHRVFPVALDPVLFGHVAHLVPSTMVIIFGILAHRRRAEAFCRLRLDELLHQLAQHVGMGHYFAHHSVRESHLLPRVSQRIFEFSHSFPQGRRSGGVRCPCLDWGQTFRQSSYLGIFGYVRPRKRW